MGILISRKARWQALLVVALGCCIGVLVNFVRPDGLRLIGADPDAAVSGQDGLGITVEEAEGFFLSQAAVFLDTRERPAYALGHIQGARSLPWGEFEAEYEKVLEDVEKDAYIIIYCDGAVCNSSEHVAVALIEKGYSNIHVLFNGWSQWQQRNLPVEGETESFPK